MELDRASKDIDRLSREIGTLRVLVAFLSCVIALLILSQPDLSQMKSDLHSLKLTVKGLDQSSSEVVKNRDRIRILFSDVRHIKDCLKDGEVSLMDENSRLVSVSHKLGMLRSQLENKIEGVQERLKSGIALNKQQLSFHEARITGNDMWKRNIGDYLDILQDRKRKSDSQSADGKVDGE